MTRPGMVGEPPTLPSKANVERLRESGAQKDAAAPAGEAEEDFVALLSKLKGEGGQDADVLPKGAARRGELTNIRRREIEAQLASDMDGGEPNSGAVAGCYSCSELDLVGEPQLEGVAEAVQSDGSPIHGLGLDAASVNDIAAIVARNSVPSSAEREPDAPMPSSSASREADPTAATMASVDDQARGGAEARLALQILRTAAGQLDQNDTASRIAAATDPSLARVSAPGAAVDKDKSGQTENGVKLAPAADQALSHAGDRVAAATERHEFAAGNDLPKASVLRQETHFAPVSSSAAGPHAGLSAPEGSKLGMGPEALGGDAAAAPSVDTAALSSEASASAGVSPARQIADRIINETASAPEFADRAGVTPDQLGMKPALKILQVQLQPADLGTVTVRMELKDAALTLHVEADRAETVELIRGDQDTLSKLLRSAGYSVDTGAVRIVESDRTAATQQSGQHGAQTNLQSSPQSQSGGSERQEQAQRGSTGTNGGETQPQTSRNEIHETSTNRAGHGLYI